MPGIEVISTVNIQHLESVNDVVEQITGVRQHEKIPDAIVRRAEQVEIVDMTPEALRRRMAHGNIYPAERVDAALGNYFRPGNLAALRELALLWVADKVDESLQDYMETHGIDATWETRERVVVAITGSPNGDVLIRRAARMAQRSRGELIGVHIRAGDGLGRLRRRDSSRSTDASSRSSAGRYPGSRGRRRRHGARALRPGGARDAARDRRHAALAMVRAHARIDHLSRAPPGRHHRRARDLG